MTGWGRAVITHPFPIDSDDVIERRATGGNFETRLPAYTPRKCIPAQPGSLIIPVYALSASEEMPSPPERDHF